MLDLITAALATWQIIEIWKHSSVMADLRATTETWEGFLGDLLRCGFCMSPWVGGICIMSLMLSTLPDAWGFPGEMASISVKAFAVARLANLGNDLGYKYCRTVKYNKLVPAVPAVPEWNKTYEDANGG